MEINYENYNLRFGGIARLYGTEGLNKLLHANILIVGVGGVGSWAAEACARSGVGTVSLVDLDDVCITNTNRQLCATSKTIGKQKVDILKERILEINPDANVITFENYFTEKTCTEILDLKYDYIIDCIDSVDNKCLLLSEAVKRNIPVLTVGGAAGKIDPTQIKIDDLAFSHDDVLLQIMRKKLRRDFGFSKIQGRTLKSRRHMGIMCVFSPEVQRFPNPDGTVCNTPDPTTNLKMDCESGMGSSLMITGTFGFMAVAKIVKEITSKD